MIGVLSTTTKLLFFCTLFSFVSSLTILNSRETYLTDCTTSGYWLDIKGVLLRERDNEVILSDQCDVHVIQFDRENAVRVCDPAGVNMLNIISNWGQSYFHLVVNEMQRLLLADEFHSLQQRAVFQNSSIFMSLFSYNNPRQFEWVKILGYDMSRIQRSLPERVNQVLVAPGCNCDSYVRREYANILRKHARVPTDHVRIRNRSEEHHLVWLARPPNARRAVRNRREALATIERTWAQVFGTPLRVTVHSEDTNLFDTRDAIQRATIVAGPHGSGFANTVFARPGTMLLEIHPAIFKADQIVQACFFKLAANFDLSHRLVVAQTGEAFAGDMLVDETSLIAAVYDLRAAYMRSVGLSEWI